jgi:hypothetical protein
MPEDEPVPVVAGIPFEVRAVVDESSIDVWEPPAPQGSDLEKLPPQSEALVFRWMASAGDISDSKKVWAEHLGELGELSISRFSVPTVDGGDHDQDGVSNAADTCPYLDESETGEGCEAKIWHTLRDGRLGLDWMERSVVVVGHVPEAERGTE